MADGVELGTAYVSIVPEVSKVGTVIRDALLGAGQHADEAGVAIGERLGVSMAGALTNPIGTIKTALGSLGEAGGDGALGLKAGAIAAAGVVGGIAVAAGTVGKALFDMGQQWAEVTDQITYRTGLVGEKADEVTAKVAKISTSTAAAPAAIANVAGQVIQSLHLEGQAFEDVTKQISDYDQMHKDAPLNIRDFGKAMHEMRIPAEEFGKKLDELNSISQQTGIPLNALVEDLKTAAIPAQDLGLTFDGLTRLLGTFEDAGLNADKAGLTLKMALGNLTKPAMRAEFGDDPETALKGVITQIQALLDQGKTGEADQLGKKIFGKSWTDFFQLIQDHKLDIQAINDDVSKIGPTIEQQREATKHWGDDWTIVKNQITDALKPLSDKVFNNLDQGMKTFMADMRQGQTIAQSFADSLNGWGLGLLALINPAIAGITALEKLLPDTAGIVPPVGADVNTHTGVPVTPEALYGTPSPGQGQATAPLTGPNIPGISTSPGSTTGDLGDLLLGPNQSPNVGSVNPFARPGGGTSYTGAASSGGGLNLSTIPVAVQKYANDCIDASARIILSHAGVNMTEDQLEGVIAPGGSIESQAAGMNRLDPQGKFVAMQGSGGSQQAMFNAIKASIDSGTGSILNVAPGSSIAGRPFSEGHFIAVTGYNPDGTINLSDTARGTQYSVSAADAFQATQGRGIVAGTGSSPPRQGGGWFPGSYQSGGGIGGAGSGDIVPVMAEPGEHMLTKADVAALGGQAGVYQLRKALHMQSGGGIDPQALQQLMGGKGGSGGGGSGAGGGGGRKAGFIPTGAAETGQPGTSMISGWLNVGNEAIAGVIDQAAQAGAMGANLFAPGSGAGIQMGAQMAKQGVKYGMQMAGIGIDSLMQILSPFGLPRWVGYDYSAFLPNLSPTGQPVTTGEKAQSQKDQQGQGDQHMPGGAKPGMPIPPGPGPGAPVQPGQLPGQSKVGPPASFGIQPSGTGTPSAGGGIGAPGQQPPGQPPAGAPNLAPPPAPKPPSPGGPPKPGGQGGLGGMLGMFGFDQGGFMPPGGIGVNMTKQPEPVFTDTQWQQIAANLPPDGGNAGPNFGVHIEHLHAADADDTKRQIDSQQKLAMMRYTGRPY